MNLLVSLLGGAALLGALRAAVYRSRVADCRRIPRGVAGRERLGLVTPLANKKIAAGSAHKPVHD